MSTHDPLKAWQRGKAWRKLPYARGIWAGPMGRTEYLADRDYRIIAYRGPDGAWKRGNGESLSGHAMINRAEYTWTPGKGSSPAVNANVLADLLARCAVHPSTAWIVSEVHHERA
ncbi:MAG: hypothetical protein ACXIU7_11415 [Roseinatronobacter sp.]